LIPQSQADKIAWMYPEKQENGRGVGFLGGTKESAEEYLLGKAVTQKDLVEHAGN